MSKPSSVLLSLGATLSLGLLTTHASAQSAGEVRAVGCSSVIVTTDAPPTAAQAPCPPAPPVAPLTETPTKPEPRVRWYGWQTLTTDGAALAIVAASANDSSRSSLGYLALGIYGLGGPIVHAANGSGEKAIGSLAMRLLAPVALGSLAYYGTGADQRDWGSALAAAAGVLVGIGGAVAVDAAVLARKKIKTVDSSSVSALHIAPSIVPVRGTATVGAAGTF